MKLKSEITRAESMSRMCREHVSARLGLLPSARHLIVFGTLCNAYQRARSARWAQLTPGIPTVQQPDKASTNALQRPCAPVHSPCHDSPPFSPAILLLLFLVFILMPLPYPSPPSRSFQPPQCRMNAAKKLPGGSTPSTPQSRKYHLEK